MVEKRQVAEEAKELARQTFDFISFVRSSKNFEKKGSLNLNFSALQNFINSTDGYVMPQQKGRIELDFFGEKGEVYLYLLKDDSDELTVRMHIYKPAVGHGVGAKQRVYDGARLKVNKLSCTRQEGENSSMQIDCENNVKFTIYTDDIVFIESHAGCYNFEIEEGERRGFIL